MNRERLRSPLGRALGLGSAKDGVEQWWLRAGHSNSAGAIDGLVRGLDHCAYEQRLRHIHRLAEGAGSRQF